MNSLHGNVVKILVRKALQLENSGTRNQSCVDLKERIFRCCAYQNEGSVFNPRKEGILLALVPTVNLIHKKDGSGPVKIHPLSCSLNLISKVFYTCKNSVDCRKMALCCVGNYPGKGCLSRSGRTVENDG